MQAELVERIRGCGSLPSLPSVAIEVLRLTREQGADLTPIVRAISKDAAMAAKVLRTVNSSFYGHSQRISTLQHAVTFLGMESTRTLVLGFSIVRGLTKMKPDAFDYLAYWRRSLYAATAAGTLSVKLGRANQQACFLAGLLMDIGMLVLDHVLGAQYGTLCAVAENHEQLRQIEQRELGLTHSDVVRILSEQWSLPAMLSEPMAHHHQPEGVQDDLYREVAEMIWLAGSCADIFVDRRPAVSIAGVRRLCMERYGINELDCDAMLCGICRQTRELAPVFEVPLEGSSTYEAILDKSNQELLAMTVAALDDSSGERRRAPRIPHNKDIRLLPCRAGRVGTVIIGRLKDISARGLGVTSERAIEIGQQFLLQLQQKTGKPSWLLYNVVRCQKDEDGRFLVGAELDSVLDPQQASIRPPLAAAPADHAAEPIRVR